MTLRAFYATFDTICGTALRTSERTVHFQTEATGGWITLKDADLGRLILLGRRDIADAQALIDSNMAHKASRATQEVI